MRAIVACCGGPPNGDSKLILVSACARHRNSRDPNDVDIAHSRQFLSRTDDRVILRVGKKTKSTNQVVGNKVEVVVVLDGSRGLTERIRHTPDTKTAARF